MHQNKYPLRCKSNNQVILGKKKKSWQRISDLPLQAIRTSLKDIFSLSYSPLIGSGVSCSDKKKPEMLLPVAEM